MDRNFKEQHGVCFGKLTQREKEVLSLLTKTGTNDEIAKKLYINKSTVATHILNICQKFSANSKNELLRILIQNKHLRTKYLGEE